MFNLHCVHPNGKYTKGQIVTDDDEIKQLMADDRDHYFVRVAKPPAPPVPVPEETFVADDSAKKSAK